MTVWGERSARPLRAGFGVVAIGVLVAIVTALSLTFLRPAVVVLAFGGIILLLPTFLMRDPKIYWLFLLVASIPFDIHKSLTRWIMEPEELLELYGPPTTGTISLDLYLTDAVLLAMVLPWLARLCLRQDRLYFPHVGYIFLLYLTWALISSLIQAEALFMAMLEWFRHILYFVFFLYLINNIMTRAQLWAVVFALFVGMGIGSGSVIAFSTLNIGTDTSIFSALYGEHELKSTLERIYRGNVMYTTLDDPSRLGPSASKRSEGIFSHPAIAAAFCGLTAPVALAFMLAARRFRDAILSGAFVAAGCLASYLTYSRAGLVALLLGCMVVFLAGRWSRLVSQQRFAAGIFVFALVAMVSVPLLVAFLELRPKSFSQRFDYLAITIEAYTQQPILGAGLNNGTIAVKEGAQKVENGPNSSVQGTISSHYLVVLIEGGLVGFFLFFAFFGQIIMIAFRSMRTAEAETKVILAGVVGGLSSIAIQNLADNVFAGHSISALLWLYSGLIIAIARRVQAERALPRPQPAHGRGLRPAL
ncbi:MAG: O-antigen ligase family protein [Methylocella sp.]